MVCWGSPCSLCAYSEQVFVCQGYRRSFVAILCVVMIILWGRILSCWKKLLITLEWRLLRSGRWGWHVTCEATAGVTDEVMDNFVFCILLIPKRIFGTKWKLTSVIRKAGVVNPILSSCINFYIGLKRGWWWCRLRWPYPEMESLSALVYDTRLEIECAASEKRQRCLVGNWFAELLFWIV